jgi:hypothetical protein
MAKGDYPFARLPRWVCRGGHGSINVAVFAALLSHGRSRVEGETVVYVGIRASAATLAREVGCDRKSVFLALRYWRERGPAHGIVIVSRAIMGRPSEVELRITCPENGTGPPVDSEEGEYRKRNGVVPETVRLPGPKTERKEEPIYKPGTESEGELRISRGAESLRDILERRTK